jgi:redox-regulated HSP33 family molecular chaperone
VRWAQAQTALALGVALDQEGVCTAAGGWYIQVLPLVSDETLECLERNIAALPSTTDLLSQGVTPQQLTGTHLRLRPLGLAPQGRTTQQQGPGRRWWLCVL